MFSRPRLVLDGVDVVARVERREVELARRARGPQAQGVHGVVPVAWHGHVVRHRVDVLGVHPVRPHVARLVAERDRPPVELDRDQGVGPGDLPGVPVPQPVVGRLDLLPVLDALAEDAVLVADAVAEERKGERRGRVDEARREAAEAAVAEAGVHLPLGDARQVVAELLDRPGVGGVSAEAEDVVQEEPARQELHREVVHALGVRAVVGVLGQEPAFHEAVPDRVGERVVDVELDGRELVLGHRVHHVLRERLDDPGHVEMSGHGPRNPPGRRAPRIAGVGFVVHAWDSRVPVLRGDHPYRPGSRSRMTT